MDIFGIVKTVAGFISGVPQVVSKIVPQGLVRDRVAEASTWQGLGLLGTLPFLWPDVNPQQQWFILVTIATIGIIQVLKKENKKDETK